MIVQLDSRHLRRNLIGSALLALLTGSSTLLSAQIAGEGGNSLGFDMAPETSQRVVDKAVKPDSHANGSRTGEADLDFTPGELCCSRLV